MPRVLHVSDTHLGFQAYPSLSPDGLNQREVDFQEAFRRVVDHAVAHPPDLFFHTGDLFDQVRPPNRAIAFALAQIRRLSEARIPTLLLSGNHDTPRLRETGHIFRVFEGLPFVRPVYAGELETVPIGDLRIHAVPQAPTQEIFQSQLAAARPAGRGLHVLAVHGTVLGIEGLFSSEFNELRIPQSALDPRFAYVALGHFHGHAHVAPNAYYAGSTESASFAEAGQDKVFLEVDVEPDGLRVTPRSTGARPMRDLGRLDAKRMEIQELRATASERLSAADADGAILRLTLDDVPRASARLLDVEALRAAAPRALHVEIRVLVQEEVHAQSGAFQLGPLPNEFEAFLERYPLEDAQRGHVRAEAVRYLAEARSNRAD